MSDADIANDLRARVLLAVAEQTPLRLHGGNSKAFYGHPAQGAALDLSGHRGVISYEPTELVLTARCGTPLGEIEQLLAEHRQMLACESPQFGGHATIGGTVATGLAGPRRPWGGAPRDLVLGVKVLDGRGQILRFGGQVMKNVAGYDVSRLMAGAHGTLGALLEVSLKVLPMPAVEHTLVLELTYTQALARMRELAIGPAPLSGACHLDGRLYLRLSGNAAGVAAWRERIGGSDGDNSFWHALRDHDLDFFAGPAPLWRLSLPPASARLECEQQTLLDWAGAQRWVRSEHSAEQIRAEVAKLGGHAILFRHGDPQIPIFHPLDPIQMRIQQGLRQALNPYGILNPGRLAPAA